MNFVHIKSMHDRWYEPAIAFYKNKLDHLVTEDASVFARSLKTDKTQHDFVFIVGIEDDAIVSLATAHYEATTNVGFIIYLLAQHSQDCEACLKTTLEQIEHELNRISNQLHGRDVNFFMFESTFESNDVDEETARKINFRRHFLTENGYEKQTEITYLQPSLDRNGKPIPLVLYVKGNIPLTKDIFGTSVKSCYILKYVYANQIPRRIIYPLLVKMGLRKEHRP